jgi:hypothetical protein
MPKACLQCGSEGKDGDKFCQSCGASLPPPEWRPRPGHEESFSRRVTAIIDKLEKEWIPTDIGSKEAERALFFRSDEDYEEETKRRKREVWLLRSNLLDDRSSIDYDNGQELKEMIANKLAVSVPSKVTALEWWWQPGDHKVQEILREVQRALEQETKKGPSTWRKALSYAWTFLWELTYLLVVIGIFSVANSKFETVVFATLVIIYNAIATRIGGIGFMALYLISRFEEGYGEIGRALGHRVPVALSREAAGQLSRSGINLLIQSISVGIGSLVAFYHLVIAIIS